MKAMYDQEHVCRIANLCGARVLYNPRNFAWQRGMSKYKGWHLVQGNVDGALPREAGIIVPMKIIYCPYCSNMLIAETED